MFAQRESHFASIIQVESSELIYMAEAHWRSFLDLSLTEFLKGSQINLAVTGLSRAGKTVFITSLIHNVLSALHQPHRMPLLKAVGELNDPYATSPRQSSCGAK